MTENVSEMTAGPTEGALIAGYRIDRQIGTAGPAVAGGFVHAAGLGSGYAPRA